MNAGDEQGFGAFAAEFVRAYWETVKSGDCAMPPNEPVEETIEELLAAVSHQVEVLPSSTDPGVSWKLHMFEAWAWWDFDFQKTSAGWKLVRASARSDDDAYPHDLLDLVYGRQFGPFLRHVTEIANQRSRS